MEREEKGKGRKEKQERQAAGSGKYRLLGKAESTEGAKWREVLNNVINNKMCIMWMNKDRYFLKLITHN